MFANVSNMPYIYLIILRLKISLFAGCLQFLSRKLKKSPTFWTNSCQLKCLKETVLHCRVPTLGYLGVFNLFPPSVSIWHR